MWSRAKRFGDLSRYGRSTKSTGAPTISSASPAISSNSATEPCAESSSVTSKSTSLPGRCSHGQPSRKSPSAGCDAFRRTAATGPAIQPGKAFRDFRSRRKGKPIAGQDKKKSNSREGDESLNRSKLSSIYSRQMSKLNFLCFCPGFNGVAFLS